MAEVGRDLWGHLVQPLLQQGHPAHPGCPGPCPERFWIYLGIDPQQPLRATCSRLWSPSQPCDNQTQPPVFHFVLPASWTHWKEPRTLFKSLFQVFVPVHEIPLNLSCELSSPRALSHTMMEFSVLCSSILFFKTFTNLNYTTTEPHLFLSWHIWRKKL